MSHLKYLFLYCYHAHDWSQPSTDVQWVSYVCNWLVLSRFYGSKGLCKGQTYDMPCIEIFLLGTGILQDELHLSLVAH